MPDLGNSAFEMWRSHWSPGPPTWDSLSAKSKAAWAALEKRQGDRERELREALQSAYSALADGADPEVVKNLIQASLNSTA
jgi:hypothetical protein